MTITWWKAYLLEPPLLVLREQPEVFLPLKRVPQGGDHFRWNGERWRVRDVHLKEVDQFGPFQVVEAIAGEETNFIECPGCGGIIQCSDFCLVGMHREAVAVSAPRPRPSEPSRPKKGRSGVLDAPLRRIVYREGTSEKLECSHWVSYKFFKYVDKTAQMRRCLECCGEICSGTVRVLKRKRIFNREDD